jgi:DNA-binding CsgD family transcriptional regulator
VIATGGGMAVVHPLPPGGVDLRAELAEHQRCRIEQALARTQGDTALAAKLLRMAPLDLVRLQAGHIAVASAKSTAAKRATVKLDDIPRIERGVEMISAAAIRRLRAEGRSPQQIAGRLGCNPFVVEKVLRIETERAIRRLRAEGVAPREISGRLGVTAAVVERALCAAPELAKCGAEPRPAPEPAAVPTPAPAPAPPTEHWRRV